jgi:hypothetical protein
MRELHLQCPNSGRNISVLCNIQCPETYNHKPETMNVLQYDPIRKPLDGSLELTLVKKQDFKLQPFGKFKLKWKTRQNHIPNIIAIDDLKMDRETTMPLTPEQDKEVVKYMKANKTEILTDGGYFNFYTRGMGGFTRVWHEKLVKYREDEAFRNAVDNGDSWSAVMINSK